MTEMYPPPTGPVLNADECRALDDEFFATDPTSYFRSRIDALLDWVDQANSDHQEISAERRRFQDILGPAASARYPTTAEQRRLHVAIDAVQLRHHAAEALLRLIHARLRCRKSTQPCSLWMALIQTPTQLHNLVEELRPQVESEDFGPILAGQIMPVPNGTQLNQDAVAAVQHAMRWVVRASEIVSTGHIDLNAANNKIKHGITARPEGRMRITFTTETPDQNGNVPLSALTGESALDVFDTVVLEYITRPPKPKGHEQHGFERSLLRVDVPVVVAETWMLALLHGAVFHTCAYRHHGERVVPQMAEHPGLATGPTPEQILGKHVVGMRFPVTTTPGGQIPRPAGILLSEGTFLTLTFGPGRQGVVVDG
jgi:hypothetical protein